MNTGDSPDGIGDASSISPHNTAPCASVLECTICRRQMRNPHMLPCLHVFCLPCLQDECSQRSRDKFFCPLCIDATQLVDGENTGTDSSNTQTGNNGGNRKSASARPWHSFDKILENEAEHDARQRRLAELPASERPGANNKEDEGNYDDDDTNDANEAEDGEGKSSRRTSLLQSPPAMFPCSNHTDRLADQYCTKCEQIACPKCITTFHRRCPQTSIQNMSDAVESRRRKFDSLHDTIAAGLALCEEAHATQIARAQLVEAARTSLLLDIKTFREEMIKAIFAKEKQLVEEANAMMDHAKRDAEEKAIVAERLTTSLGRQLDVMSFSLGAGGEGELLPYLPGMEVRARADAELAAGHLQESPESEVSFVRDEDFEKALDATKLGTLHAKSSSDESVEKHMSINSNGDGGGRRKLGLTLTLEMSFHGGARDDIAEPLLTDLVLLANGDVILTDRDNHCVKKFNRTGKLLTRVMLDASPSRIAVVSHGRAVVSTTNRRELYFLSLQGTVRVLSSVRVKKLYSFLTSLGGGVLAAGTNYGNSVDLITESGQHVRTIVSGKIDRAGISRPFYITPVHPAHQRGFHKQNHSAMEHGAEPLEIPRVSPSADTSPNLVAATVSDGKRKVGSATGSGGNKKGSISNSSGSYNNSNNHSGSHRKSNVNNNKSKTASDSSSNKHTISANNAHSNNSFTSSTTTTNSRKKSTHTNGSSSPIASLATPSDPQHAANKFTKSTSPKLTNHCSPDSPYSQDDLWVTDSARKILFRLRQEDGSKVFTLKSQADLQLTLECPLGITVHPSGLPLLVDRDSDAVLLLDEGGNYIRSVLTSGDGLSKPCAIYAGYRGQVVLSQVDGMVKLYSSALEYL